MTFWLFNIQVAMENYPFTNDTPDVFLSVPKTVRSITSRHQSCSEFFTWHKTHEWSDNQKVASF